MQHLPRNVRRGVSALIGHGYIVTLADGREVFHRFAWEATARANGWTPPYADHLIATRTPSATDPAQEQP